MAKKTSVLIALAKEKLTETNKVFKENSERLEELIFQRGTLKASEAIGDIDEAGKNKIKELSAIITELKDELDGTGLPLINALKDKIVALEAQKKEEDLEQAKLDQDKIEADMHKISVKLIPMLEQADKLNRELRSAWGSWTELSKVTGRGLTNTKVSFGSEQMLNLLCGVLRNEWEGRGGKGRNFYNRIAI